ncbi:APC family permease [Sphingomicrobium lutaoense]|uniref:Arginine/agmatine antiporter n=1 Tax=Sphingomicrobium lutaoense TaxID=515949 RepID=A0A839Z0S8_9SPHN|nr:APC family permease [Sphingomicrobium lutaoense]MBB3763273.1 amino acid transporter [Sphingomicrobium lutaoense]
MTKSPGHYRRDMGTLGVLFLVVNGLIGAGIFGLPEILHVAVGAFAPWLLLLGGMLVMTIVLCFAQLTRLTDRSGGPQRFVTDAYGRFAGFQIGWLFFSARLISQGANVLVLAAYAAALWPVLGEGVARTALIVAVLGGLTLVNIFGIRRVVTILGAMTFLKLLPLILLILFGLAAASTPGPVALPQFSAVEGIALAALYAFVGFENATIPAGETRDPRRAMPRALLLGLALVTMIYFGLQWVYSHSPIAGSGPDAPLTTLAGLLGGDAGAWLIAATIVLSVLANLTAGHTSASRMPPALADDGLLPAWFGQVSRWGTPANSIAFFGAGAILFALNSSFLALAIISTLARLIAYIASILSLPRLRKAAGLPMFDALTLLAAPIALALSIWATFQTNAGQWQALAAFVAIGTFLYFIARRTPRS